MKIAFAMRRFAPDGGTGRFAVSLARGLLKGGHQVRTICMEHDGSLADEAGFELRRLAIPRLGSFFTMAAFAAQARREVRRMGPDVALALGRIPGLDIYRAGGGCHEAYLDSVSGWWMSPRHHLERRLDRASVLQARFVVVNASDPGQQLIERYGADPARIVVIPNGVDRGLFKPDAEARRRVRDLLGLGERTRLALFLGAGFRRKGLTTAIEAAAALPRLELAVVGGDRGVAAYRRQAGRLGLRLHLLGARPDPQRFLAAADVMLLPTRYDSAANAVLESMACAVPPVTSAANGAAEFIPERDLVVENPRDARGFADATRLALETPGLGASCQAAARQLSWARNREALLALFARVQAERADATGGVR